ncbi:MAG: hypothetical protein NC131_08325 [Roseburia sp.]|nr:hypothetical protein [Roseburia sp.]
MRGRLIDLAVGLNGRQRVTVEIVGDFREKFNALKDADITVEFKKWHKPRSNKANNYLWGLLEELAVVLGADKDELYISYVRRYGVFKDFTMTQDEAKTFRVGWGKIGTGWPTEQVDFDPDGDRVVIRAYYGSSTYNSKQMSRLIDAVVQDCKEQGIETDTPEQLARYKEEWARYGKESDL